MKHINLLLLLSFLLVGTTLSAQSDEEKKTMAAKEAAAKAAMGWKKGGSLGLDLSGLGLKNPRLGAGLNKFGYGGVLNLFATNKGEKTFWDNNFSMLLSALRLGGKDQPFQKSNDILRLNSRYGYNIIKDKLFLAIDAAAESQLLPTYTGNLLDGADADLLSKFLSPARISVAPGIDFRPNAHMKFFFAPVGFNLIYVGDDNLAQLAGQPLGNEVKSDGTILNRRFQLGYLAKAEYSNKYFNDKIAFLSRVGWFADYRKNLNGNVLWQNSMDLQLFKGLSLNLFGELFYDHFSKAIVREVPAGTTPDQLAPYLGLNSSYTGGFFIKYNRIF
ncbi:MAG: hypothetical protein RIR11_3635 [Bacteroidota bacterium]|jgi:hypothetical protein